MARIPYPDPASLPPLKQQLVAGSGLNVTRMLVGASDGVLSGFIAFSGAFFKESKLPPMLREVAILRVGHLCGSRYETFQHEALARRLQMTEAQLEAIRAGGAHPDLFDPAQQAVLDFAGDVAGNVRASDRTLEAVRRHLTDEQVIDLTLLVGCYITLGGLLETAGVELDQAPVDWNTLALTRDALARDG